MKGRVCMNSTAQTACYSADSELMNKKFLTPKDLMYLMDIGESLVYKYLSENPPFRTERVGKKIIIFANSFWSWYNGES